jgi:hypothetical protein
VFSGTGRARVTGRNEGASKRKSSFFRLDSSTRDSRPPVGRSGLRETRRGPSSLLADVPCTRDACESLTPARPSHVWAGDSSRIRVARDGRRCVRRSGQRAQLQRCSPHRGGKATRAAGSVAGDPWDIVGGAWAQGCEARGTVALPGEASLGGRSVSRTRRCNHRDGTTPYLGRICRVAARTEPMSVEGVARSRRRE